MMRAFSSALCIIVLAGAAPAAGQQAVGWRTDGTGKYPSATPPTEWSPTKNVVWRTRMPSWSNATPVIVGDRIFVCSEPATLVCVNAADGTIRWTKPNTYADVLPPEVWAQAQEDIPKAKKAQREIQVTRKEMGKLARILRKKRDDAEAKKKLADLKAKMPELVKQFDAVGTYLRPPTNKTNGYSSPTPVSDGRHVHVLYGNGVAACYDLDGNRKWGRWIEKPLNPSNWGHSTSPALAGGKLLIHLRDLVALDKNTGKEVWRAKCRANWGSPVVTRVGRVDVVVTPGGDVVGTEDGKILAKRLGRLTYCAPIVNNGVAYFIQAGGRAAKLSAAADGKVTVKPLWTTRPKKDRYYASPVLHDGLIYTIDQKTHFSVIDAKDGKVVHQKPLNFGKRGQAYQSVTLGGKFIFLSRQDGTTVVLEPSRQPKQVAENKLETFRASIVCVADRIYIRTVSHLYCIGSK